ncbi:AMP-binding enzyme, partial [Shewanella algae]|uniref:AMP-binding enzyme n=1 Tax=Shewanella algae TaxID=38313 RepID=UPI00313F8160
INEELGQIVAYIAINVNSIDKQTILEDIKAILPPYMVPRFIRVLPVLPKNPNGKIDRKQLK